MDKIFLILIIMEMVLAGIVYLFCRKYGSALYWFLIGAINFAVVFLMERWG